MPVLVVCDGCRAEYHLKDEYGGRKVRCRACGSVISVSTATASDAWRPPESLDSGPFDQDRFLIKQVGPFVSEHYYVFDDRQNPMLFAERPGHLARRLVAMAACVAIATLGTGVCLLPALMFDKPETRWIGAVVFGFGFPLTLVAAFASAVWLTPSRNVSFYRDNSKAELLLEVLQDPKPSLFHATYTIRDPQEGTLAQLRKSRLSNLFRKRWNVHCPDGALLAVAREDTLFFSLFRRTMGPLVGLLRTNFVILHPHTEMILGEFNRKSTLFDCDVLDMSADRVHELDRRLAVALGVLLDLGEKR